MSSSSASFDLSCDEDMEDMFPEEDGLTDEILANLDVNEVNRREQLFQEFPKCSISQENQSLQPQGDVLNEVLQNVLSPDELQDFQSRGEREKKTETTRSTQVVGEIRPIPVEISSSQTNSSFKPIAKKSIPVLEPADDPNPSVNLNPSTSDAGIRNAATENEERTTRQKNGAFSSGNETHMEVDPNLTQNSSSNEKNQSATATPAFSIQFDDIGAEGGFQKKEELGILSVASQITKSILESSTVLDNGMGSMGFNKNGESGFQRHDFPDVSAEALRGSDPIPEDVPGNRSFVSVRELAVPGKEVRRTVPDGIVPFVLVQFHDPGGWKISSLAIWEEMANLIEIKVLENFPHLRFVLRQNSRWKGTGSFGLSGDDVERLEKWRDVIPTISPTFNTFPRDALTMSEEVTVMLMGAHWNYHEKWLPYSLFTRNTGLQGHVRVSFTKKYGKQDFTSQMISKDGWRLCYLEGDALFLQSLRQFSERDRFPVGGGTVTIRGGGFRKPSFLNRRFALRKWSDRVWTRDNSVSPLLRALTPISATSSSGGLKLQRSNSMDNMVSAQEVRSVRQNAGVRNGNSIGVNSQRTIRASGMDCNVGTSPQMEQQSIKKKAAVFKPRTRSERLKLQKEKSLAARSKLKSV